MSFKPSNHIHNLKDEYGEFFFLREELDVLKPLGINTIFQIFQDEKGKPDPEAKRVQLLLSHLEIGENSRVYRLEELRQNCDEDPANYTPRVHTAIISHAKLPNTYSPSGDGYLPRRARGELTAAATDIFDGTSATRKIFDNYHRGAGYGKDDYGSWNFD